MKNCSAPGKKAFSFIGPSIKKKKPVVNYGSEKRSSIIMCHITFFKRVLIRCTICRVGVLIKSRTIYNIRILASAEGNFCIS